MIGKHSQISITPSSAKHYIQHVKFERCVQAALNVAGLASFVVSNYLFRGIANPSASRIFDLQEYKHLHATSGFYLVELSLCMFGYVHPATGKLARKI